MLPHENHAKAKYLERRNIDIAKERHGLSNILAVGRLHFDKNFHSLAVAFRENKQLQEKANLVFVINGPQEDKNENYILNMQKALKKGEKKLKGFSGSTLDQLMLIADILDCDELKGKWTAISLPDGRDFAGIQRYLGKQGNTISGLFSLKEPYGLAPWESVNCGIPVVVSGNAGVAGELIKGGAYCFSPNNTSEISAALLKTLHNFEETKMKLMEAAKSMDWCETAKKLIINLDKKPRVMMSNLNIYPLNVEDPTFIQDGKDLIFKTLRHDYKCGLNGDFKEIFESLQQYETK